MSDKQPHFVVNCDLYWACLSQPNQMSGKYQVDLCNLSDAAVEKLESTGVKVMNNEDKADQGAYVTAKSKYVIEPVNTAGDQLAGIEVGNGSKARAVVRPYEWSFKGKQGVSVSLMKLVIDDLVIFEKEAEDYDMDEAL